jgi:hypothetical protein
MQVSELKIDDDDDLGLLACYAMLMLAYVPLLFMLIKQILLMSSFKTLIVESEIFSKYGPPPPPPPPPLLLSWKYMRREERSPTCCSPSLRNKKKTKVERNRPRRKNYQALSVYHSIISSTTRRIRVLYDNGFASEKTQTSSSSAA